MVLRALISLGTVLLFISCASAPSTFVAETVGPARVVSNQQQESGFLTVYSATVWMTDGDSPTSLRHTDYEIDMPDGRFFDSVSNSSEEPTRATLPTGAYTVVAQSDTSGTVSVPILIESGQTTVLHLEREGDWQEASAVRNSDLVRLPNGQPIGFRARSSNSLKTRDVTVAQSKQYSVWEIPPDESAREL